MHWHRLADKQPSLGGFYWTWDGSDMSIGYWTGKAFQVAETVGDREGLSVEMIPDVTHWRDLDEPLPPPVDNSHEEP